MTAAGRRRALALLFASAGAAGAASEAHAAECAECHAEIEAEWRGSLHRVAFTDSLFRAEYDLDPSPYCRGWHAPAADPAAGVGCDSCHPAEARDPEHRLAGAPRPRRASAAEACAPCHEIPFPERPEAGGLRLARGQWLQRTVTEWRASPAARRGETCVDCHMPSVLEPDGERHASHAFPGGRDPALLARALRVSVTVRPRAEGSIVLFGLRADRAGHSVPTGDVFRQLEISAWPTGDRARRARALLGRVLGAALGDGPGAGRFELREIADDRVPPSGVRSVRLRLRGPPSSVSWAVDLLRTGESLAAARGIPPERNRVRIAAGEARPPHAKR